MRTVTRADQALLCIGGSAGGLPPLLAVLGQLPSEFHAPVIVAVHRGRPVGQLGRSGLARMVEEVTDRPVREVEDLDRLAPDAIFLAPAGYHTLVMADSLVLSSEQPENHSIPSIDALFESAADAFGERVAALALSCANTDGARGAHLVAARGGQVIIQDPTSAEYPMLVDRIIADGTPHVAAQVPDLGSEIVRWIDSLSRRST